MKLFYGPEPDYWNAKKGGMLMADKGKKEPKPTTSQTKCGCGCLPEKK